ncbi:ABC transporter permease [Microbacterium deminutum]|uniref:ABC transporter permease n=1 Tax=Microbacterium deminutum TaxID=344164 RepID=A0ABN2R6H5_9MICO
MVGYITKRAGLAAATLLGVSILAFLLVHAMPGSPGQILLGLGATPDEIAAENQTLGWNDPLVVQYLRWAAGAVRGDFGTSLIDGHDIGGDLLARLPVTVSLAAGGTLVSAILGITLGVAAAVRGGATSKTVNTFAGISVALPAFWLGIILVFFLAVQFPIFPASGYVPITQSPSLWASSLFLPVLTLAIGGAAFIARQTRASMIDALSQEHIRTLRATATPTNRILYVHALRYASLPIVASVALQFIALFGGSVVAEQLFALPGLGNAIQKAVGTNDSPSVLAVVVVATLVVILVNLLLEFVTLLLDPRLRAQ